MIALQEERPRREVPLVRIFRARFRRLQRSQLTCYRLRVPLSEETFAALVEAGCSQCSVKRLRVESFVVQRLALLGGEPYGAPVWGYKGEDLVRGTYRIGCESCGRELYTASDCSRCGAEGGVERALEKESALVFPPACARCGNERLDATAFVPALVVYEGKRAKKAHARAVPEEPGFHAVRVWCTECNEAQERSTPCPLCA
jgi:hypothetical protein